jgi:glycosyltransferase involved in cell wall biosynthesis
MKITVILCTYNRCQSLSKALESVAVSILPESVEWEVLVVDNNSKDQTGTVVEDFSRRYPGRFRYWFEPKQGKSYALNTAIQEAKGTILAFMDDDVIVDPAWLRNLTAALGSGQWAGVGGRIRAQQTIAVPSWLSLDGPESLDGMLALFDLGDQGCQLDRPPFGTNMAFPKAIFERYGSFRTDLGPCPGSEIRNEDTEFGRRLMSAGEKLWYEPSAVVFHAIPEIRLSREYFLKFWYDHGRALVRERKPRPDILGIPRQYLMISKIGGVLLLRRLIEWSLTFDRRRKFYQKGMVWSTLGQLAELHKQLLEKRH